MYRSHFGSSHFGSRRSRLEPNWLYHRRRFAHAREVLCLGPLTAQPLCLATVGCMALRSSHWHLRPITAVWSAVQDGYAVWIPSENDCTPTEPQDRKGRE